VAIKERTVGKANNAAAFLYDRGLNQNWRKNTKNQQMTSTMKTTMSKITGIKSKCDAADSCFSELEIASMISPKRKHKKISQDGILSMKVLESGPAGHPSRLSSHEEKKTHSSVIGATGSYAGGKGGSFTRGGASKIKVKVSSENLNVLLRMQERLQREISVK